jgi:glycine cleavage system H protein
MVALLVLLTIVMFLTIDYLVQRSRARAGAPLKAELQLEPILNVSRVRQAVRVLLTAAPKGVFLDKSHQWLELASDGTLKIGVDHFPGAVLGAAFSVTLPKRGMSVRKGESVVTIRKGDRVLSVNAPADGEIEEINESLASNPARTKDAPFADGWLYRMKPKALDPSLFSGRMLGEEALSWTKNELRRLREFVMSIPHSPNLAFATLQDGGEPVEGFAEGLNDEQWKRLKEQFFA